MITVALLFLVSEGILPIESGFSAFLNNTLVVVIFAPIIKNWAKRVGLSRTKFQVPDTAFIRNHTRRTVHANRHIDKPGSPRNDDRLRA